MSYKDPYKDPYATQYIEPVQRRYADSGPGASNKMYTPPNDYDESNTSQDYEAYDGYRDEPDPPHAALPLSEAETSLPPPPPPKDRSLNHDFAAATRQRQEPTAKALKRYRYDIQGNLWTKGGSGRFVGRFCCCTILITSFVLISTVLSFVLWVRPPNIDIGNVAPRGTGNPTQVSASGMNISLGVQIIVSNPNSFSVALKSIDAEIDYPINNTNIGSGQEKDITFPSNSMTTFTFPFTIMYRMDEDPSNKILVDIATKCGVIGGQRSDITVKYKITLGLRLFLIPISPVVSNTFSFGCPVSASDLSKLLQGAGLLGASSR